MTAAGALLLQRTSSLARDHGSKLTGAAKPTLHRVRSLVQEAADHHPPGGCYGGSCQQCKPVG